MNEIGLRLVKIRKKLGLTQKTFAERLDVSIGTVQGYEYGQIPKGEVLKKLSDWKYNLNWLFTGLGSMEIVAYGEEEPIEHQIIWNVAYYLCKRTNAVDDANVFANTFMEVHEWMMKNAQKPVNERASAELTAEIIDFAMQRLNAK